MPSVENKTIVKRLMSLCLFIAICGKKKKNGVVHVWLTLCIIIHIKHVTSNGLIRISPVKFGRLPGKFSILNWSAEARKKRFLPFFLLVWKVTPLALCNISLRRYFPKFRNTFDTKFRDMTSWMEYKRPKRVHYWQNLILHERFHHGS